MNTIDIQGTTYELADRWARFTGLLADSLILIPIVLLHVVLDNYSENVWLDLLHGFLGDTEHWEILLVVYYLIKDGMFNGQSVGKIIVKTQVISIRTGVPCAAGESIIRNLPTCLIGVIDWLFIFNKSHQRIGDKIAKTVVIKPTPQSLL